MRIILATLLALFSFSMAAHAQDITDCFIKDRGEDSKPVIVCNTYHNNSNDD